jgi:hypothetical protein
MMGACAAHTQAESTMSQRRPNHLDEHTWQKPGPHDAKMRDAQTRAAGSAIEFGELRSLLQQAPSEELWRVVTSVLRLMEVADPAQFEERVYPYAERALERWPDALRVMTQHWQELARADKLPARCARLVRAVSTYQYQSGDTTAVTLLDSGALSYITHLRLSSVQDIRNLIRLLCTPEATQIAQLSLEQCAWHHHSISLTDALADAPGPIVVRPRSFQLTYSRLHDEELRALSALPLFERVEHLDLSHCYGFSATGLGDLLCSTHMRRLRTLNLSSCGLDAQSVRAIQDMPLERASLTALDLSMNKLDADAMRALADAPMLANLRTLNLSHNSGIGEGARALFEAGHLRALEELDLTDANMGEDALAALLAGSLDALRALKVGGCQLGEAAGAMFADAPLPALEQLDLRGNKLGNAGAQALFRAQGMRALHALDLSKNELLRTALDGLSSSAAFPALRALSLGENQIGDRGARSLAASALLRRLERLDISLNKISANGAVALVSSPHIATLKHLYIANNPIPSPHRLIGLVEGLEVVV